MLSGLTESIGLAEFHCIKNKLEKNVPGPGGGLGKSQERDPRGLNRSLVSLPIRRAIIRPDLATWICWESLASDIALEQEVVIHSPV